MSAYLLLTAAILFATVLTGFFAGAETGAISANRTRLRNMQRAGDQRADEVISLLSDTQRVLTVTLVGTNLFSILAALFAKRLFSGILETGLGEKANQMADLLSLVIMTPFLLIFSEILPKQVFREKAENLMMSIRKPLRLFSFLFIPAVHFFNSVTYIILSPLGIKKGTRRSRFTKDDLKRLVDSGEQNGSGDGQREEDSPRADMIQSIFQLEKTLVREVMKPLVDVTAIAMEDLNTETALNTVRRTGYSRLPVYKDTIVNMVGYIDIYDIIRAEDGNPMDIRAHIREPFYVPETKRIDDLLQEMLSRHMSVAICFDEYGGCSGFVTIEDIIEEIVGEIDDEFDRRSIMYYEEKPGIFNIDPKMDLDDLKEELGIDLPKKLCDTAGGFVYSLLGRVPAEKEQIAYPPYIIQVLEVKPPRIIRLRIIKEPSHDPEMDI